MPELYYTHTLPYAMLSYNAFFVLGLERNKKNVISTLNEISVEFFIRFESIELESYIAQHKPGLGPEQPFRERETKFAK